MYSYQRLDTCENGRHVICWAPPVLKNVQTDPTVSINIGVEHLGEELDHGGLVGVLLTELHGQFESSILNKQIRISEEEKKQIIPRMVFHEGQK